MHFACFDSPLCFDASQGGKEDRHGLQNLAHPNFVHVFQKSWRLDFSSTPSNFWLTAWKKVFFWGIPWGVSLGRCWEDLSSPLHVLGPLRSVPGLWRGGAAMPLGMLPATGDPFLSHGHWLPPPCLEASGIWPLAMEEE